MKTLIVALLAVVVGACSSSTAVQETEHQSVAATVSSSRALASSDGQMPLPSPQQSVPPTAAAVSPPPSVPPTGGPASSPPSVPPSALPPRPNIVVIMVDDLAQMDDRVLNRLPNIKTTFLANGVRFTDYQGNNPLCCPGRANFLSGQTSDHNGVIYNDARLFDPTETIATELQGVGYWTGIVGKYLNKMVDLKNKYPPGWNAALISSGGYSKVPMWRQGTPVTPKGYSTDIISAEAVADLRRAPSASPVFLLLTPTAPHADNPTDNYQPRPAARYVGDPRCRGIPPWNPPSYNEANVTDKPAYIRAMPRTHYPGGWPLQKVCESLLSVDLLLSNVQHEMKAEGRDNTLFMLTDDNGMAYGAHRWPTKFVPYATPMPLFVDWPGHLAAGTRTATVSNLDMAPTLCALAGCQMGPYRNGHGVDGMSFLPVLMSHAATLDRAWIPTQGQVVAADGLFWHGVRSTDSNPLGRLEYTEYANGACELYDLKNDPWELVNRCNDPAYAREQQAAARELKVFRSK